MNIQKRESGKSAGNPGIPSPAATARWHDFVLAQASVVHVWSDGWVARKGPVKVRLARIARTSRSFS
jgi:hypothetical protein